MGDDDGPGPWRPPDPVSGGKTRGHAGDDGVPFRGPTDRPGDGLRQRRLQRATASALAPGHHHLRVRGGEPRQGSVPGREAPGTARTGASRRAMDVEAGAKTLVR